MAANYDRIAGIYDTLARCVYGNAIEQSQLFLLRYIAPGSSVLIVGGGTGWILEALTQLHHEGLQIVYVELSAEMMRRAQKRIIGNNQVSYITAAIEHTPLSRTFDVVITPFVLDNFSTEGLKAVFQHVNPHLRDKGLWLYADFQLEKNRLDQKLLLKLMYLFFGVVSKLKVNCLPDAAPIFEQYHYRRISQQYFYRRFITAIVYQKQV